MLFIGHNKESSYSELEAFCAEADFRVFRYLRKLRIRASFLYHDISNASLEVLKVYCAEQDNLGRERPELDGIYQRLEFEKGLIGFGDLPKLQRLECTCWRNLSLERYDDTMVRFAY